MENSEKVTIELKNSLSVRFLAERKATGNVGNSYLYENLSLHSSANWPDLSFENASTVLRR